MSRVPVEVLWAMINSRCMLIVQVMVTFVITALTLCLKEFPRINSLPAVAVKAWSLPKPTHQLLYLLWTLSSLSVTTCKTCTWPLRARLLKTRLLLWRSRAVKGGGRAVAGRVVNINSKATDRTLAKMSKKLSNRSTLSMRSWWTGYSGTSQPPPSSTTATENPPSITSEYPRRIDLWLKTKAVASFLLIWFINLFLADLT